ncbi:MAG: ABC transporter permease [Candidatus Symbiothrix sp.]|jgi:hypothetical protein|nr:ABC transporter permease [Candidatus Symbiothrix sp.]
MIKHYLTVAIRNLLKYKIQSVISIIGLAIGFSCFALATLWIRYEMTYDTFHKDADRIYMVRNRNDFLNYSQIIAGLPYPMASYLKETFPEIDDVCNSGKGYSVFEANGEEYETGRISVIGADSAFLQFFNVKILEGNNDFILPESNNIALTADFARSIFGNENPLGKVVNYSEKEYTVCAIVENWPHSNLAFQALIPNPIGTDWVHNGWQTFIKIKPGTNSEALEKKIKGHTGTKADFWFKEALLTPITRLRYDNPLEESTIKFGQLYIVVWIGGLIILCSLFNFLTLFISRFKIREKELALRTVCGASGKSLFVLLSIEFVTTLLFALLLGSLFIRFILPYFQRLSNVYLNLSAIYLETVLYIGVVILFALLVFAFVLIPFRKKNLNRSFRRENKRRLRNLFLLFQLIISIGFSYCTLVMIKQIYFLQHTDSGFEYKNTASIFAYFGWSAEKYNLEDGIKKQSDLDAQLKQLPEIIEIVPNYHCLMPKNMTIGNSIDTWEDMPVQSPDNKLEIEIIYVREDFQNFYKFQLVKGDFLKEPDANEYVLLSETAAKALGWKDPIGKTLAIDKKSYAVKGILKDIYYDSPTIFPTSVVFMYSNNYMGHTLIKYREGGWKNCKEKIERMMKKEFPGERFSLNNAEEAYEQYIQSENALLQLLSFGSVVCIVISIFGFFSLISLSCEERRKEIAIRKVNGATLKNILSMYFKTYFLLLLTGSVIAFPIGYFIMKQWIEQYVKQTGISAWLYLSIVFVLTFVVVLCVGWRVYKASIENPAEVLKSE